MYFRRRGGCKGGSLPRSAHTTVNNVHPVLRLSDPFGLGCVRVFSQRVALEEFLCYARLQKSPFEFVELLIGFPRFVLCLIFLVLGPI